MIFNHNLANVPPDDGVVTLKNVTIVTVKDCVLSTQNGQIQGKYHFCMNTVRCARSCVLFTTAWLLVK